MMQALTPKSILTTTALRSNVRTTCLALSLLCLLGLGTSCGPTAPFVTVLLPQTVCDQTPATFNRMSIVLTTDKTFDENKKVPSVEKTDEFSGLGSDAQGKAVSFIGISGELFRRALYNCQVHVQHSASVTFTNIQLFFYEPNPQGPNAISACATASPTDDGPFKSQNYEDDPNNCSFPIVTTD